MFNVQIPFFNALWRRVLLTVALFGWTGFELWHDNVMWAILFGALGVWCAWSFFVTWPGPIDEPPQD